MAKTLKDYLSMIPNAKQPNKADLEAYRQEMLNKVIPRNLRAAADKKRLANESRFRAAQASAKRDADDT
jgi:hypothetical protein